MFFVTYLRGELRRRMRQAIFIALGLALGIGLVVTVAAASSGFRKAQSDVLSGLYGIGTDVTVTGAAPAPPRPGSGVGGPTQDNMNSPYQGISASKLAGAARLHDVAAAAGGLSLLDQRQTLSQSGSFWVDGVDIGHLSLGPLNGGTITSGHSFTAADADADVALVDSGYARAEGLTVGSTVTIQQIRYAVIGIVSQPQEGGNPTDVYVPLARAQAISLQNGVTMQNEVNTIYLTATSAADISAVSSQVARLLPGTTVTTASSLASDVTGSVKSVERLVNDFGTWLAVLVLIAAFAAACLLTAAAVARRVREFGTLKAIGWESRRVVAQVLGESLAIGIAGAVAGVGLGFAGAAIIAAVAPKLPAAVGGTNTPQVRTGLPPGVQSRMLGGASLTHPMTVPVHPSVSVGMIIVGVLLAMAGGLLAGALGSWRIARLRPVDALARVA